MLRTLFGKRDLGELEREAEQLFGAGKLGEAKLAFDRVAERARKDRPERIAWAESRAAECCDLLALARANDALKLHAEGHVEQAHGELAHALETARSEDAQRQINEIGRELERREALEQTEDVAPLGDEERWLLISGSWEPAQAEELERYGAPLEQALLALEGGEPERALPTLQELLERDAEASYLWLELGRVQLSLGKLEEAETALRRFIARIASDEGGTARLLAHRELARLAHERGEHERAITELEACAEALGDDPRPYLDLGNYLRAIERPREAVEVLDLCVSLYGDNTVEWPVTMELGLACAGANDARATPLLESVLAKLLSGGQRDVPPLLATTLADLHEKSGNLARAADLYRTLSEGSDAANRAHYHEQAARLLDVLSLTDEAARMRARAAALRERG